MIRGCLPVTALALVIALSGCASVQPRNYTSTSLASLPWKDYDGAEAAFKKIKWGETTFSGTKEAGFDPEKVPNTEKILDVKKDLLPSPNATMQDLEGGALVCYRLGSKCQGYSFIAGETKNEGVGNTFLWMLNIKSERVTSGWEYRAKIYFARRKDLGESVYDPIKAEELVAIYGLDGGRRKIETPTKSVKPLGPGQMILDIGGQFSPVKPRVRTDD